MEAQVTSAKVSKDGILMIGNPNGKFISSFPEVSIISSYDILCKMFEDSSSNCCILNTEGTILWINKEWKQFCENNNGDICTNYIGLNYLRICQEALKNTKEKGFPYAKAFTEGLQRILSQFTLEEFQLQYPCDSPSLSRIYLARVNCFPVGKDRFIVVSHELLTSKPNIDILEKKRELETSSTGPSLQEEKNEEGYIYFLKIKPFS